MYTEQELNQFDIFVSHFCIHLHRTIKEKKVLIFYDFDKDSVEDMLFLNMSHIICALSGIKIELDMNRWDYFWFNKKSTIEFTRHKPTIKNISDENIGILLSADRKGLLKTVLNIIEEDESILKKVYEAYYKK